MGNKTKQDKAPTATATADQFKEQNFKLNFRNNIFEPSPSGKRHWLRDMKLITVALGIIQNILACLFLEDWTSSVCQELLYFLVEQTIGR